MADDLYAFTKYDDDEQEKFYSKWEIVNYLRKNYKVGEKMLQFYRNNINLPITINKNVDELYRIIKKNDTGPKDIVKFIIALHDEFPRNVKAEAIEKIIKN
jgi:hypothetical protein